MENDLNKQCEKLRAELNEMGYLNFFYPNREYLTIEKEGMPLYKKYPTSRKVRVEMLDPYEYLNKIGHLITKDKNSVGRCWFRAYFPSQAKAMGV